MGQKRMFDWCAYFVRFGPKAEAATKGGEKSTNADGSVTLNSMKWHRFFIISAAPPQTVRNQGSGIGLSLSVRKYAITLALSVSSSTPHISIKAPGVVANGL